MAAGKAEAGVKTRRPAPRGVAPGAVRRRRPKTETKAQLIEVAGELIGEFGYGGCSISRVTAKAGIAHGAFYNHFRSQQELFDQVLPALGRMMFREIATALAHCASAIEVERKGFAANFSFLEKHPYMYRVLTEAEMYAPEAYYRTHVEMADGYARSLRRSLGPERYNRFTLDELKVVATMLIGARTHLLMVYGVENGLVTALPHAVRDQYFAFAESALARLEE